jgi:hypothetical protein
MQENENTGFPAYVTEGDLEKIFGLSKSYWQKSRLRGDSVPFYKIGRTVKYKLTDVEAFFQARKVISTSEAVEQKNSSLH